jgi:hypothetical protein
MPEATLPLSTRSAAPTESVQRRRRRRPALAPVLVLLVLGLAVGGGWAWWRGSIGSVAIREHCTAEAGGNYTELDPEQAGHAAVIAGIASRRALPARAATIGIATAIQESKLRNVEYGDRDSLGLFQQRPSQGWGTRKQILDPVYATNAFYDVLSKIDGFENLPITAVAQRVQRSAFPSAYADHEPQARVAASALTGYSPAGFSCVLRQTEPTPQSATAGTFTGRATAVRDAVRREQPKVTLATPSGAGSTLRLTRTGEDADRIAWGVASWGVARAAALQVVSVEVAGQIWSRDSSTDGWQPRDGADLPTGQVRITVA